MPTTPLETRSSYGELVRGVGVGKKKKKRTAHNKGKKAYKTYG